MKAYQFIVGLVLSAALSACSDDNRTSGAAKHGPLVKSMVLTSGSTGSVRSYPGNVIAGKTADLAFQVPGKLNTLAARDGLQVTEGQVLAELDKRDYQNTVNARQAEVDKHTRNLERMTELVRKGAIAQVRYDEIRAQVDVAKANFDSAKKSLEDTVLKAPFTGRVAKRYVENHQFIQAKQRIVTLQDISYVDIEVNIPEQDVALSKPIKSGRDLTEIQVPGHVTFTAVPGRQFQVKIKEYSTQADPALQTYRIVLTMPAPGDINILPGMTASFELTKVNENSISTIHVPVSAVLIGSDGKHYVWVINPENLSVEKREITVDAHSADSLKILAGVKSGERIVTAGVHQLQPGMKVRLMADK